ncbi:hypothetical protein KKC60_00615, partial [Patescibacteria group bacterium]|nr:hypothetical protein [Patescibacteria group bacterium]
MKKSPFKIGVYVLLILIVVIALVSVMFGMKNAKQDISMNVASDQVDTDTKEDMLNSLWLAKDAKWPEDLPAEVQQILADKQNTPAGLGQNTAEMISDVGAESTPLVKKYPDRYEFLADIAEKGLSPRKAYNLMAFMGQDYFKGYDDMDSIDKLTFPKDHSAHEDFPFGWYFFSGNFKDQDDNVVDVVVVFFRRAIYPPPIAKKLGLSQLDNQTVETVVAVNYADKNLHILGSDPLVS